MLGQFKGLYWHLDVLEEGMGVGKMWEIERHRKYEGFQGGNESEVESHVK